MLKINTNPARIAEALGVCMKTVYNELERGKHVQQTSKGERRYICGIHRRSDNKQKAFPGTALAQIEIDGKEFDTHICETTLYNWIYRGDVFLNVTEEHLLYKGDHRKPVDRKTFSNLEMDSIVGHKGSRAALVSERSSITVDNGCEFQDCEGMERSKRARNPWTKIYYCHPYSAYERGSNENMNRIIRRFFPKGTNFDKMMAAEATEVEERLVNYPRRILGWKKPQMLFEE